jgi:hypothetical protein
MESKRLATPPAMGRRNTLGERTWSPMTPPRSASQIAHAPEANNTGKLMITVSIE